MIIMYAIAMDYIQLVLLVTMEELYFQCSHSTW